MAGYRSFQLLALVFAIGNANAFHLGGLKLGLNLNSGLGLGGLSFGAQKSVSIGGGGHSFDGHQAHAHGSGLSKNFGAQHHGGGSFGVQPDTHGAHVDIQKQSSYGHSSNYGGDFNQMGANNGGFQSSHSTAEHHSMGKQFEMGSSSGFHGNIGGQVSHGEHFHKKTGMDQQFGIGTPSGFRENVGVHAHREIGMDKHFGISASSGFYENVGGHAHKEIGMDKQFGIGVSKGFNSNVGGNYGGIHGAQVHKEIGISSTKSHYGPHSTMMGTDAARYGNVKEFSTSSTAFKGDKSSKTSMGAAYTGGYQTQFGSSSSFGSKADVIETDVKANTEFESQIGDSYGAKTVAVTELDAGKHVADVSVGLLGKLKDVIDHQHKPFGDNYAAKVQHSVSETSSEISIQNEKGGIHELAAKETKFLSNSKKDLNVGSMQQASHGGLNGYTAFSIGLSKNKSIKNGQEISSDHQQFSKGQAQVVATAPPPCICETQSNLEKSNNYNEKAASTIYSSKQGNLNDKLLRSTNFGGVSSQAEFGNSYVSLGQNVHAGNRDGFQDQVAIENSVKISGAVDASAKKAAETSISVSANFDSNISSKSDIKNQLPGKISELTGSVAQEVKQLGSILPNVDIGGSVGVGIGGI